MSTTVEKLSGNQVKINFNIPAEEFDKAMNQAYLKIRGRVNIPGFRKGKAPRKVIENYYGEAVFYDDAVDLLFPDAYEAAVKENSLEVVDRPELEKMEQIGSGKDCIFNVTVYIKPEITLGDYKALKAVKYIHTVTDEEIDNRIKRDVDKATTMADVEGRALENGDTVNLDYAGTVDGIAFEGGTAQGQTLELGSGSFIPGFEEQMIGMNIGEEKDLQVKFPEEYHAENLKGKDAVFHVKVNSAQAKVKPEMNDDFAADVSDFNTFDEYRANIVKELENAANKNSDVEVENTLVQAAVDSSDCDIPKQMIEDEIDVMIREMKMRMMYQGIKFEDYIKYTGQTEEQVREMYRTEAQNRVKMQLVLEAIIKKEEITSDDDDLENMIKEEAERAGREIEEFKASLNDRQKDYLRENASIRKAVDLIKANAVITEESEKARIDMKETVDAVTSAVEAAEDKE